MNFIGALIITVISALIIVGGVYAYDVFWSGKAVITIESPSGSGHLEIIQISTDKGTWNESAKTWTVSIPRGGSGSLNIELKNTGGDFVVVSCYVSNGNPASGVTVYPRDQEQVLAAGAGTMIQFYVVASTDAQPGTLPEIELQIRM